MLLNVSDSTSQHKMSGQLSTTPRFSKPGASRLGLFPLFALTSALGVLLIAISYDMSRYGNLVLEFLFLPGLLMIYVPPLVRLLSRAASRVERLCLLSLVGMCFFLVQLMISPLYISSYDALLHWITADTMSSTQHLYGVNSLLPVSPYYPGLEIVTNALSSISGLTTFQAGTLVIAVARFLMVLALFLFYEQVTMSGRVAGIATMIYMTNPHFLFFDAIFSYETLALPLATFLLYILARYDTRGEQRSYRWLLVVAWLVLAALTITHHMTDYVFVGFLVLWAIASLFQRSGRHMRAGLTAIALCGLLLALANVLLVAGNPLWEYLSSYFTTALNEIKHILTGAGQTRQLFAAQGVPSAPPWDRLLMLGSVALVTLGLPFGLFRLWKQHRRNVLAITLGIVSLAYPVTQVFRFTNYGAEITDRSAAFLFLPIAYVLAVLLTRTPAPSRPALASQPGDSPLLGMTVGVRAPFWSSRRLNWRTTTLITCALAVMLLGGALLEAGPAYSSLPGPYRVIADGRSVEPTSIQAAQWALSHLGPNNRVATDRINQTLFGTFGQQRIVTQQEDNVNISLIFYASSLDQPTIALLREARIRYVVVDLRLSTSLPLLGYYYEADEPGALHHTSPVSREALIKFSAEPQINQVFDDGSIIIYDVSALTGEASQGSAVAMPSNLAQSLCC